MNTFNENDGKRLADGTFKISWLTGVKEIKIKPVWIKQKTTKNWFKLKREYYIVLEHVTIGPFNNYSDAYTVMKTYHV